MIKTITRCRLETDASCDLQIICASCGRRMCSFTKEKGCTIHVVVTRTPYTCIDCLEKHFALGGTVEFMAIQSTDQGARQ